MKKSDEKIAELWAEAEVDFPDKSTEFLSQIVCDRYAFIHGADIDHGDVAAALAITHNQTSNHGENNDA